VKIKVDSSGWEPMKDNIKKVKEGVGKMREALEKDYMDSLSRSSGLPKDWRSRLIKAN